MFCSVGFELGVGVVFFFSSRRRHTRLTCDWSSDVCSSDLVALERPNSGAVTLGGVDVSKLHGGELRRKRRDLQLMFQDPHSSLDPRMRVGTIIGEPLAVQRLGSKRAQRDRVFELLSEVGPPRSGVSCPVR